MLFPHSKIVLYGVQKLKGKHVFKKTNIIHVWHIVSSVAQKRNPADFSDSSFISNEGSQKIQYRQAMGNWNF